ncbi:MAG: hypothetical protein L6R40_006507 [Gallowayella cf. fulva]|nr:MAG: hypothetical protein L6R40_006507 [Xanthomendoza cf. fulva]
MPSSSVPDHCYPTNSFFSTISSIFYSCIPTPLALISTTLGILSIVSWLFAQLPQLFKNYKLKSASGLSIYFLGVWLLGDLANLLGALLTRQAAWQVVVAAYYVTVDVCLVSQYLWYSHYKPWRATKLSVMDSGYNDRGDGASTETLLAIAPPSYGGSRSDNVGRMFGKKSDGQFESPTEPKSIGKSLFRNMNYSWSPKEKATPNGSYRSIRRPQGSLSPSISPNTLLMVSFIFAVLAKASPVHTLMAQEPALTSTGDSNSSETAGRIFSWLSTLLYNGSRLPQIYRNHKRRSTAGLSPILFIAAFFGNLFYSCSLLANPLAWNNAPPYGLHGWAGAEGSDRGDWISRAIPFFLGAAGVLVMDAIVGIQFLMLGEKEATPTVIVVQDERGRSHWRKVSGWMRGWVPSPGPTRRGGEDGRSLRGEDSMGREHSYGAI